MAPNLCLHGFLLVTPPRISFICCAKSGLPDTEDSSWIKNNEFSFDLWMSRVSISRHKHDLHSLPGSYVTWVIWASKSNQNGSWSNLLGNLDTSCFLTAIIWLDLGLSTNYLFNPIVALLGISSNSCRAFTLCLSLSVLLNFSIIPTLFVCNSLFLQSNSASCSLLFSLHLPFTSSRTDLALGDKWGCACIID